MNKEEFQKLIQKTSLTGPEKNMWLVFAYLANDDPINSLVEVLQNNPEDLKFLTQNVIKKARAVKDFNLAKWQAIVAEEKDYLEKISK